MKLTDKSVGLVCLVVWLVFLVGLGYHWPSSVASRLMAISALILVSHILYAGYFLLVRLPRIDLSETFLISVIAASILISSFIMNDYGWLGLDFITLFVAALLLHQQALTRDVSPSVNALARYKIRLELGIIGYILLQTVLMTIFKANRSLIAGFGLGIIVISNFVVIARHKIYQGLA